MNVGEVENGGVLWREEDCSRPTDTTDKRSWVMKALVHVTAPRMVQSVAYS